MLSVGTINFEDACRLCLQKKVGSYQSGGAFAGWRALTIESSLMSGSSQG